MARLPVAWQQEIIARHARHHPDLHIDLRLGYDRNAIGKLLGQAQLTLRELRAELGAIVSINVARRSKQQDDEIAYFLQTARLSVLVRHEQRWRDGAQVAQIRHIGRHSPRLTEPGPYVTASAAELNDADPFDLHEAFRRYEAAVPVARDVVRADAYGGAAREPSRERRDELDRRLLPAKVIIDLVDKRAAVVNSLEVNGVVVMTEAGPDGTPPATDVLRVLLEEPSGALAEDANATLLRRGQAAEPITVEVVDAQGPVVLLRPRRPRDLTRLPDVGAPVTITREGRSGAGRTMGDAISRARNGNVAGDWDALARLLTRPGSLQPSPPPPADQQAPGPPGLIPPRVTLTPEQAGAVHRAVAAPHALFLQGPPGTGKSTVITEVVRQLAARGERILLAAPMHVAVDEVLSRLSNDPLVWPMRIAADPDNIREDLRYLHEKRLGADIAGRVAARASDDQAEWPAEIARLRGRVAALSALRDATAASAQANSEYGALERSGQRERAEAEALQAEQDAADAERRGAAGQAAATAAGAAADSAVQLLWLAEHAHEAVASLAAGTRQERRDAALAAAGAEEELAASRRDLDEATAQARALDARIAETRETITSLHARREEAWPQAAAAMTGSLARAERQLQQGDPGGPGGNVATAEAAAAAALSSLHELRQQRARLHQQAASLDSDARRDDQAAAVAAARAAAAGASYQRAEADAGIASKMASALGFGRLAAARGEADNLASWSSGASFRRDQSRQAAHRARSELAAATSRVVTAERALLEAEGRLHWATGNQQGEAAAFGQAVDVLMTSRQALARPDGLPSVLAALEALQREAQPAASSLMAPAAVTVMRDLSAEAGRAVTALRGQDDDMAVQLAQARADLRRVTSSSEEVATRRGALASDVESQAGQASRLRERLAAAVAADDDALAAERAASAEVAARGADLSRAQEEAGVADAEIARQAARKVQRTKDADQARERLAEVTARRERLRLRASDAKSRLAQARTDAQNACDGPLPPDPASGIDACQQRIARLTALIGLEGRWREMLAASAADGADPAGRLGIVALEATNLVCSTVAGIATSPAARGADFDTLILDEASRVTDPELLVPAVRARRWILVGDERQLPPYVDQEMEQHVHAMLALRVAERKAAGQGGAGNDITGFLDEALAGLADVHDRLLPRRPVRRVPTADLARRMLADGAWAAQYRDDLDRHLRKLAGDLTRLPGGKGGPDGAGADPEQALIEALAHGRSLSRFEQCVAEPEADGTRARLTLQRRMIAPIAELVREPVYHGEYHTPADAELRAAKIVPFTGPDFESPVTFVDSQPSARGERLVGTGFVNDYEAALVVRLLHIWDTMAGQGGLPERPTFSVLTFYKAQAALIERRLTKDGNPLRRLERRVIDSVDKIQGQESDLVAISFVRSPRLTRNGRPAYARPGPRAMLWLQDIHRLNVAVTRAKLALALVGDSRTLQDLRGNPEAEAFYKNLFRKVGDGDKRPSEPGYGYVGDLGV